MDIHKEFVRLGRERNKLTYKLLELLPKIFKTEIYKKYSGSIIEYAGKFGGLSKGVVLKRLRLEKQLEDKPLLRAAIAKEGVHKVALVASLATPETEKVWIDKVENMSKEALQELSKEVRLKFPAKEISLFDKEGVERKVEATNCQAVPTKITIELDEEMTFLFLKLKKKLKEQNNKEAMKKILEMANKFDEKEINKQKNNSEKHPKKVFPGDNFQKETSVDKPVSRYIPAKIKKLIISQSGEKCSYPNCNKPAEIFHHTERFAVSKNHDNLKHLCKVHHEFVHNGLVEDEKAKKWQLKLNNNMNKTDNFYKKYRKEALN